MQYDIDKDYDLWLEEQAKYLRNRTFEKLDINNLVEELEALVRGEKSAVRNLAINILIHLTYCEYWTEQSISKNHWKSEIASFRDQLNDKLTTNLKNQLIQNWDELIQKARRRVYLKIGKEFPVDYTIDQVLDEDFFP